MTPLMEGFTTLRRADSKLIEQYEWHVRHHGATSIQTELACAERTVTALTKSLARFKHLQTEHTLAMNAAARAMRALASDLAALADWAKEYYAFCISDKAKQIAAETAAFAHARWGSDPAAHLFEANLVHELTTFDGTVAFGNWIHATGRQLDVGIANFNSCFDNEAEARGQRCSARLVLAKVVRSVSKGTDHEPHKFMAYDEKIVYCFGFEDYEKYLCYRLAVA